MLAARELSFYAWEHHTGALFRDYSGLAPEVKLLGFEDSSLARTSVI